MMIASFIFVISLAAVIQFTVLSWRAGVLKLASEALPAEWESAASGAANSLIPNGFRSIAAYNRLFPELGHGSGNNLRSLWLYYRLVELVDRTANALSIRQLDWTSREMALCTRCAAVMLSHRLEDTQALLAAARSF
ncbi:MAG TPA: hypothetical protein VEJ67_01420 [Candidatus Cybelea sp.]|nr:hypothetical protein [Candidatus Cybelea sp.]